MNKYQKQNANNKSKALKALPSNFGKICQEILFQEGISPERVLYVGAIRMDKQHYHWVNALLILVAIVLCFLLMRDRVKIPLVIFWILYLIFLRVVTRAMVFFRNYGHKFQMMITDSQMIIVPWEDENNYLRISPNDLELIECSFFIRSLELIPKISFYNSLDSSNKKAMMISQYKVCNLLPSQQKSSEEYTESPLLAPDYKNRQSYSGKMNNILYAILSSEFSENMANRDKLIRKLMKD